MNNTANFENMILKVSEVVKASSVYFPTIFSTLKIKHNIISMYILTYINKHNLF